MCVSACNYLDPTLQTANAQMKNIIVKNCFIRMRESLVILAIACPPFPRKRRSHFSSRDYEYIYVLWEYALTQTRSGLRAFVHNRQKE